MQHPRRIGVQLHAAGEQLGVIGDADGLGNRLVALSGQQDAHVRAALRRIDQRAFQLAVDDEIGRHNVHIAAGGVEDIEIHGAADVVLVEGLVGVGHDEAGRGHEVFFQKRREVLASLFAQVPHL